jgi:hypothetical protein
MVLFVLCGSVVNVLLLDCARSDIKYVHLKILALIPSLFLCGSVVNVLFLDCVQ